MSQIRFVSALFALFIAFALAKAPDVWAGEAADYTREALTKGQWDEADQELSRRIAADAGNDEARFGLAMVRFARAIEKFGRHQYRHGLNPDPVAEMPLMRFPLPHNPKPELLTYETQRAALQALLDDLAQVDKTLAGMQGKDVKIVLDLEKVRLDFAPGTGDAGTKTLMNLIRAINPAIRFSFVPETAAAAFEVAFDNADVIWLRGYCHLLSAGLEFVLAHDWRDTFNMGGSLFYPSLTANVGRSPLATGPGNSNMENRIADAVALIHQIRWPVAEAERLKQTREHLKQVVALSRRNWQIILAETDDDREWIPSPAQKNAALPTMTISAERVAAWMNALDAFDAVLDGRKLIPHWRTEKGINMKRALEEPRTFDLVLWVTGHAAIPYLEDGPVLTSQEFAMWQRVFGGDFLLFAVYFN